MAHLKLTNHKASFVKWVFVLAALVYLVRSEGEQSNATSFSLCFQQTEIGQVAPDRPPLPFGLAVEDDPLYKCVDSSPQSVDLSFIQEVALTQFNSKVIHQLRCGYWRSAPVRISMAFLSIRLAGHQSNDDLLPA